MKVFAIVVVAVLFVAAEAAEKFCYNDAVRVCDPVVGKQSLKNLDGCSAKYGGFGSVLQDLQRYTNLYLARSFEFLMMATHYGNYQKNREGFEKLFRGLSDEAWNDSIELIKYITKRGGSMNFSVRKDDRVNGNQGNYELYELESVAKALDIEKQMAEEAFSIHAAAGHARKDAHDPEVINYIEEEFAEKHSKIIRELSGYANDLKDLLEGPDNSIALYLFDLYLQKK